MYSFKTNNSNKIIFESILLLRALRAIYKPMNFFSCNVQLMRSFALNHFMFRGLQSNVLKF